MFIQVQLTEEAFNAQWKFLREGKEVVVVDVPTDDEVEEQNYWEKSLLVGTCKTAKEHLRTGEDPTGKPIAFAYLQQKRAFVEEKCSNPELTPIHTKETLTKRTKEKNRLCNEEQETSQFVCKEWKVSGDEIMKHMERPRTNLLLLSLLNLMTYNDKDVWEPTFWTRVINCETCGVPCRGNIKWMRKTKCSDCLRKEMREREKNVPLRTRMKRFYNRNKVRTIITFKKLFNYYD